MSYLKVILEQSRDTYGTYSPSFIPLIGGLMLLFLASGFTIQTTAQTARPMTRPYADHRRFNWGFHVGLHVEDLIIDNLGPKDGKSQALYAAVPHYSPGFSVGVIANYNPHIDWSIRTLPTLHFGEQQIFFHTGGESFETISMRTSQIEVPLLVKYSSVRFNDTRPYIVTGAYGLLNMGQKKGAPLQFTPLSAGWTIGVGCDIYLRYFKLSPELRFDFGVTDLIRHNRPDLDDGVSMRYTDAIRRGTGRMIMLTFCFE
jgi:porT protein